jgi:hypothetical protein
MDANQHNIKILLPCMLRAEKGKQCEWEGRGPRETVVWKTEEEAHFGDSGSWKV